MRLIAFLHRFHKLPQILDLMNYANFLEIRKSLAVVETGKPGIWKANFFLTKKSDQRSR